MGDTKQPTLAELVDAIGASSGKLPTGTFIWTDPNGVAHEVTRDDKGTLTIGDTVASKTKQYQTEVKTYGDGTTHTVTFNPDGTVKSDEQIAGPKPAASKNGQFHEKFADGDHLVTYKDGNVVSNVLTTAKATPATSGAVLTSGTKNTLNTSAAGLDDAKANKLIEGVWATYEPQIAAIHVAQRNGTITDDQAQAAIDGLTNQAIQEAQTGMTAAQRATIAQSESATATQAATARAGQKTQAASQYRQNAMSFIAGIARDMPKGSTLGGDAFAELMKNADLMDSMGQSANAYAEKTGGSFDDGMNAVLSHLGAGAAAPSQAATTAGTAAPPSTMPGLTMPGPGSPGFTGGGQQVMPTMPGPGSPGFTGGGQQPGRFLASMFDPNY